MITNMGVVVVGVDAGLVERVRQTVVTERFPTSVLMTPSSGLPATIDDVDPSDPAPEVVVVRRFRFQQCSCGSQSAVYVAGERPKSIPCPTCQIEFEVRG